MQLHWILLGATVLSFLIPILFIFPQNDQLERRKTQSKNLFRENVLKQKLEKFTEERVRFSKRYQVETLCLQAGLSLSYAEFMMISIASALILGLLVGFAMNNVVLAAIFFVIGYMLPKQVISFIKNIRVGRMEKQIGSFMQMVIKRYEATKSFSKALELTLDEFRGEEPLYSELKKTVTEIKLGKSVQEAMNDLARRSSNKFMQRLSDYYAIASEVGTEETQKNLLRQAFLQYEEDRKIKMQMKKELASVKRESYIMLGMVPIVIAYQIMTNDQYIHFMTNTTMGKIGTVVIVVILLGCLWLINAKISAPLD